MFVYIAAREKKEHRPLVPHVDRSSAARAQQPASPTDQHTCLNWINSSSTRTPQNDPFRVGKHVTPVAQEAH